MSIRLPRNADPDTLAAFRDIEQQLEELKASIPPVQAPVDLTPLTDRLQELEHKRPDNALDAFVGSGPQSLPGLVPAPGGTADNEAVLTENGGWGYPIRGLVRAVTKDGEVGGVQTGADVVEVLGHLEVLGKAAVGGLDVHGTSEPLEIKYSDANHRGLVITAPGGTNNPGVSPDQFSGLQGWYKADSETGLNDGDAVTTFTDRSGNSRNFTGSGTARPLYKTDIINGHPVLRWDGTNDIMASAALLSSFIANNAGTIFVVAKPAAITTAALPYDTLIGDNTGYMALGFDSTTEGVVAWNFDANADEAKIAGTMTAAFHSFLWLHSGGTLYVGKDDAQTASLTGTASGNTAVLTAVMDMGAAYGGSGVFTAVDIAEVIIYNVALAEDDRMDVERYLANKYGLTLGYSAPTYSDADLVLVQDAEGNEVFRISGTGYVYVRGVLTH